MEPARLRRVDRGDEPAATAAVCDLQLAIVHAAVYDAVNAIDGGHEPYLDTAAVAALADAADSKDAAAARPPR